MHSVYLLPTGPEVLPLYSNRPPRNLYSIWDGLDKFHLQISSSSRGKPPKEEKGERGK